MGRRAAPSPATSPRGGSPGLQILHLPCSLEVSILNLPVAALGRAVPPQKRHAAELHREALAAAPGSGNRLEEGWDSPTQGSASSSLSHSRACRESGLLLAPHHSGWSRPPAFRSPITLRTPNPFVVSSTLQSPTPAFFRKVIFNSGWNVHSVASIHRLLITRILQNLNSTAVE